MAYVGKNPKFEGVTVSKSSSGATISADVANSSNSASSKAAVTATVAGASADDAVYKAIVSGVTTWSWGVDNSDSDAWVLAASATLGTTNALRVSTAGDATLTGIFTAASYSNNLSAFAATTSAQLAGVISDETGSGALVFANTPTLVTPVLGVATATSINKVAITAPASSATLTIADGKTLTASNTLTFTGTDSSSVAFGAGGTVAYVANKLSVFAATSSSELAGVISDETGSGALVFANTPTLVTPVLGVATATSINKVAITAPATSATLTIANGKTLTASNTLTFTGTDSSSVAFGAGGTAAYTENKLSVFAATSSSELAGVISDETGSGALVFGTSPTLKLPTIGDSSDSSKAIAFTLSGATTAKTLTISSSHTNNRTLTLADGDMTVGGNSNNSDIITRTATQTLTNKTMSSLVVVRTDDSSTGTVNNMTSSGLSWVKFTASTTITLNGIAAGVNGQRLIISNVTGNNMTITHNSGSATGATIRNAGLANITLGTQGSIEVVYDSSSGVWWSISK